MRELEFLPAWYPQTRRRRRMVVLHAYMTVTVAAGLGLFMFLAQRNVHAAEHTLSGLSVQMDQTATELRKLDEHLALQKQLLQQDQIHSKLGQHIEVTRMLNMLDQVMPPEMALVDLKLETTETLRAVASLSAAPADGPPQQIVDRRLKVSLQGVAPTDVDVANFLARLSNVPFFEQVAMSYARDRSNNNHMMREFEVTFSLNLSAPIGN